MKKAKAKNQIRKIRRMRGWTLTELTKSFQVRRNEANLAADFDFVKRAEAGENIPLEDVQALAKALGVKQDAIYPIAGKIR